MKDQRMIFQYVTSQMWIGLWGVLGLSVWQNCIVYYYHKCILEKYHVWTFFKVEVDYGMGKIFTLKIGYKYVGMGRGQLSFNCCTCQQMVIFAIKLKNSYFLRSSWGSQLYTGGICLCQIFWEHVNLFGLSVIWLISTKMYIKLYILWQKIQAKWESGLTTVQLKWDPPVWVLCSSIGPLWTANISVMAWIPWMWAM